MRSSLRFLRRIVCAVVMVLALGWLVYALWSPGLRVRDGRHDLGRNGIWLGHGWLGADEWFTRYQKMAEREKFRSADAISVLARQLRERHITDVFPHLCPASSSGGLPAVDDVQVERFLDAMAGLRVIPWVGGPNGAGVRMDEAAWRTTFCRSVAELFIRHPRLAGVQLNVEPCPSGDVGFLELLEGLRQALPAGKLLSVAAYPPPTRWQPAPEVHWEEAYFREVARRSDQLVVMMYDTSIRFSKPYTSLMADWTREALAWSEGRAVLLGVPTYDDAGVGYHHPAAENLTNALAGIHGGLGVGENPATYQGLAIYCEWETDSSEWDTWRQEFLRP